MEKIREGLNQYILKDHIQNSYFREFEYEMIHQNELDIFLGMQLRQSDESYALLYDVTGSVTMEAFTDKKELRLEDCKVILKMLQCIFHTVEDYLLEMKHICFAKDKIFRNKSGKFQLLYCPDSEYDVEKDVEELFAWMLSRLDYRDSIGVRLVYQVYDMIRNEGFSLQTIEKALLKIPELENPGQRIESYHETIEVQEEEITLWKENDQAQEGNMHDLSKEIGIGKVLFVGGGILISIILCAYWIYLFLRYGFLVHSLRYLLGSICIMAFFAVFLKSNLKEKDKLQ